MEERRKFPRLECPKDKTCRVTVEQPDGFCAQLKNISRDGASLVSKNRLVDNTKLNAVINFSEIERNIPSVIQIVWSRFKNGSYTYGGKLLSINREDKYDLLDNFYESWKKDLLNKRR